MIRTLVASMVVSMTAIATAGDCGAKSASSCTGDKSAVTTVSNDAGDCSKTCDSAKVMTVSNDSGSCATACPMTGAAVTTVSNDAGDCSKTCDSAKVSTVANGDGECAKSCDGENAAAVSLVSYMPKMGYRVDGNDTCCPKTAGEMAKKHSAEVHYVVGETEYCNKPEAMAAHAKQLDAYMMDLVRIQYAVDGECVPCPDKAKEMAASCSSKKMQYKVGPATFDSAEAAIAASIRAYNAAQKVSMEYAVGDEMTTCSVGAKDMAKKADCSVEYVVNGKRTKCSKEAGYLKTVASVESALKALEIAQAAGA
jgi:hypothetical protein